MNILEYEDRLVSIWRMTTNRKTFRRGKRVAATCPLTTAERRVYVKEGSIQCIKAIMDGRGIGLVPAKDLLDKARGGSWQEHKARRRAGRQR